MATKWQPHLAIDAHRELMSLVYSRIASGVSVVEMHGALVSALSIVISEQFGFSEDGIACGRLISGIVNGARSVLESMVDEKQGKPEQFILECDNLDARAIHEAIARHQRRSHMFGDGSTMPDGGGNMAGRVIAEICRGWMELCEGVHDGDS